MSKPQIRFSSTNSTYALPNPNLTTTTYAGGLPVAVTSTSNQQGLLSGGSKLNYSYSNNPGQIVDYRTTVHAQPIVSNQYVTQNVGAPASFNTQTINSQTLNSQVIKNQPVNTILTSQRYVQQPRVVTNSAAYSQQPIPARVINQTQLVEEVPRPVFSKVYTSNSPTKKLGPEVDPPARSSCCHPCWWALAGILGVAGITLALLFGLGVLGGSSSNSNINTSTNSVSSASPVSSGSNSNLASANSQNQTLSKSSSSSHADNQTSAKQSSKKSGKNSQQKNTTTGKTSVTPLSSDEDNDNVDISSGATNGNANNVINSSSPTKKTNKTSANDSYHKGSNSSRQSKNASNANNPSSSPNVDNSEQDSA